MLEIKNNLIKINAFDALTSRLDMAEEIIMECEDM